MNIVQRLFGLNAPVARREYLLWGFGLAALKFGIDTMLVRQGTGKTWSPLGYLLPSLILRDQSVGNTPAETYVLLAACALPFLWIGLSMSVRRAVDAGKSPLLGLLFVIPVINYGMIAYLAALRTADTPVWNASNGVYRRGPDPVVERENMGSGTRAMLSGMAAAMLVGIPMTLLSVFGLKSYGMALFFLTPFAVGVITTIVYARRSPTATIYKCVGVTLCSVALIGTATLLFALEGALCVAMAFPIAAVIAIMGSILGWVIATRTRGLRTDVAFVALLPTFAFAEAQVAKPVVHEVTTTTVINAPADKVWEHVVGFTELPPPPEWFFKLGIAYPMRARIQGSGVGAVRRCEFSTGPFIEPITVWDPPKRLAFDVTSQPPSMQEWSPYEHVNAPHLEGYMVSRGGEFNLVRIDDGHTRLEGTTRYTLSIYPELYWAGWGETLLHAIHGRVLAHVKTLSEAQP